MILAIETSASVCAVGFYSNGKILAEYKSDAPMKHSELVGQFIERGIEQVNDDIHLVCVAVGPGSFTGLRIGLSYAQGFCFGKDIPVVGISNHQILAKQGRQDMKIFTIIDAHRQELYLARHKINDLMDIDSHKIIKRTEIENELPDKCQLIFPKETLGDAELKKLSLKNILCLTGDYKTSVLAEIGQVKYNTQGGQNPENIEPMYIRPFAGVQ